MATHGKSLTEPNSQDTFLWRHEVTDPQYLGVEYVQRPNFTNTNPIPTFFKTPTISWAAFNPMNQLTGIDRWMELKRIEPDFLSGAGFVFPENWNVQIITKEYAQSQEVTSVPQEFNTNTEKIDFNIQGRHMNFTFTITDSSSVDVGNIMLLLSIGDGK